MGLKEEPFNSQTFQMNFSLAVGMANSFCCLLALLLLVPIFAKTFHISLGVIVLFIAIYVSIIVPISTGIISRRYVLGRIRKLSRVLVGDQQWNYYLTQLSYISSWLHYIYLQVDGVQTFTTQVVFNIAAEKLFCPSQKLFSLYVLLFYSFLAYVQRSFQERPWTRFYNEGSRAEIIKLTTALVVVRLGKGVALTLVLLSFSYQFNDFEPKFIAVTFLYFCLSQYQSSNSFRSALVEWLTQIELQCLEGMEEHWVLVIIHLLSTGLSVTVFMGLIVHTNNYIILILLGYINFSIPFKYSLQPAWEVLCQQRAIISRFSLATWNNPQIQEGSPCPVCLDVLRVLSARVTPCGHVFHGSCLRKCFKHSKHCPLCKTLL